MVHVYGNAILNALDAECIARLHLQPVQYEGGQEIEVPGNAIRSLHFLESGMASMKTILTDGSQVEAVMFGYESIIGASAFLGVRESVSLINTQIPGHGFRCFLELALKEFALGGRFQSLALRFIQTQIFALIQSACCNAKHNNEQRLARWLLHCTDRVGGETFRVSHKDLSDMLGCTRSTISLCAAPLQAAGLIRYHHGSMCIVDRPALEATACECYQTVRKCNERFVELDCRPVK